MAEVTVARCRELLDKGANESLSDEQLIELHGLLRTMAGIIIEVFGELHTIDQSRFYPTGKTIARAHMLLEDL